MYSVKLGVEETGVPGNTIGYAIGGGGTMLPVAVAPTNDEPTTIFVLTPATSTDDDTTAYVPLPVPVLPVTVIVEPG
jgi:hypothetical protein